MTDADVAAVQAVIADTGALAELEAAIDALAGAAVAALDTTDLTAPARAELVALADFVVRRAV